MAKLGEWFFYTMAGIQVSLILLAAPAAAAGSICMDRARGTLAHMMATDLSDPEIVLGKLGSRLAPIIGLIACGLPVAALATLLGGVEFGAIAGLFMVSAVAGSTRMYFGADYLGLGGKDSRGTDGGLHVRWPLAARAADLGRDGGRR